jgi:hypothetical protein
VISVSSPWVVAWVAEEARALSGRTVTHNIISIKPVLIPVLLVDRTGNILAGVGELDRIPSKAAVLGASAGYRSFK